MRFERKTARPGFTRTFFAPGRVNLIGEHTDYGDGLALAMAIDRGVTLEVEADDARIRLRSDGYGDVDLSPDMESTTGWGRYVLAVAHRLERAGHVPGGVVARLTSDLEVGAGLSSSAALEVVVALSLLGDRHLEDEELIRLCRDAEEEAVGVPCGLLDQAAAVLGRRGEAVLLAFEPFGYERASHCGRAITSPPRSCGTTTPSTSTCPASETAVYSWRPSVTASRRSCGTPRPSRMPSCSMTPRAATKD